MTLRCIIAVFRGHQKLFLFSLGSQKSTLASVNVALSESFIQPSSSSTSIKDSLLRTGLPCRSNKAALSTADATCQRHSVNIVFSVPSGLHLLFLAHARRVLHRDFVE